LSVHLRSGIEQPTFNLKKVANRRTLTLRDKSNALIPRQGRVWLFGVEPYSYGALLRPTGVSPHVSKENPFDPAW
jgi:hypothetical protein